ncbi:class I SAM-dependent methyltransferase [Caenimonas sedimenti]|nr:class I SAM-dependent methyltransferase [Caenimonas sedimenti]
MPTLRPPLTVPELRERIEALARISNEEWLAGLSERKKRELEFHDRDRDRKAQASISQDDFEKYYSNKKYYSTVRQSVNYTDAWIARHVPGKVFLDFACGNGMQAIKAASLGAALAVGFDISPVSVANAAADAQAAGVSNAIFFQADAENTKLPDGSVDVILCSGMLHHLDLSYAMPELRRILAPGGRILAVEALDYNPFIKLYRMLTPAMRTDWEKTHILGLDDVAFARRFFDLGELRFWHITSYAAAFAPRLLGLLDALDSLLARVPLVQRMAWIFTFELLAREDR